jgi:hypothetical protein
MAEAAWICVRAFCSVPLVSISVFVPTPCCVYGSMVWFEVRYGDTSCVALFFQKIDLAIQGLLHFFVNFRIYFPIFMKNVMEIWMGISLNLLIASSSIVIFTILILPTHELRISFIF